MAEASDSELAAGRELAGYRIEAVIGRGGMGIVYRALDLALDRKVALKLLAPELADDADFRERFHRESRLAASLDHPAIVPIYEAGEAEGRLYIAMRLVEGGDLRALLRAERKLDPARTLELLSQVAEALDAAHERGLVHRDVKPSNVLLDSRGHCYLADFGLSRQLTDSGQSPAGGLSLGTSDYAAPEQIRGEEPTPRTDVYAFACLLYECLAGEPPFRRPTELATVFAHLEDEPPTLLQLEPVLQKGLAKEPGDRYQTCGDLIDAAREGLGLGHRSRRRWLPIAVAATAALAAGTVLLFMMSSAGVDTARANLIAKLAVNSINTNPRSAVSLAVKAAETAETAETEAALRTVLARDLLETTLHGHTSLSEDPPPVFSHSGTRVLAVSGHTLNVWDARSGRRLTTLPIDYDTFAAVSPNGTEFATYIRHSHGLAVKSVQTGRTLRILVSHHPRFRLTDAAFSPDGNRLLAFGYSDRPHDVGPATIWRVATGRSRDLEGRAVEASFSTTGREIAAVDLRGDARILDAADGHTLRIFRHGKGQIDSAKLVSNDRLLLMSTTTDTLQLWNARSGRLLTQFHGRGIGGYGDDAGLNSDGSRLIAVGMTASGERKAMVWDVATGRRTRMLGDLGGGDNGPLGAASFGPDPNELLTFGGPDGTARIWDVRDGRQLEMFGGRTTPIDVATLSPGGRRLLTGNADDGSAQIWRAVPLNDVQPTRPGTFQSFSPDSKSLLTVDKGVAAISDIRTGHQVILHAPITRGMSATFNPNGATVLTTSERGPSRIWNLAGKLLRVLPASNASFTLNGKYLYSASKGHMWDAATGRTRFRRSPSERFVAFSPNGNHAAFIRDDAVWIANLDIGTRRRLPGKFVMTTNTHGQASPWVGINADGSRVAAKDANGVARLWDATNDTVLKVFPNDYWLTAEFNRDGTRLLTAGPDIAGVGSEAELWNTKTGRHLGGTLNGAFTSNGRAVIGQIESGGTQVIDSASGRLLRVLRLPMLDTVFDGADGALSLDGKAAVTVTDPGTVRIWDMTTGQVLDTEITQTYWTPTFSPDGTHIALDSGAGHYQLMSCDVCGVSFRRLLTRAKLLLASTS